MLDSRTLPGVLEEYIQHFSLFVSLLFGDFHALANPFYAS